MEARMRGLQRWMRTEKDNRRNLPWYLQTSSYEFCRSGFLLADENGTKGKEGEEFERNASKEESSLDPSLLLLLRSHLPRLMTRINFPALSNMKT